MQSLAQLLQRGPHGGLAMLRAALPAPSLPADPQVHPLRAPGHRRGSGYGAAGAPPRCQGGCWAAAAGEASHQEALRRRAVGSGGALSPLSPLPAQVLLRAPPEFRPELRKRRVRHRFQGSRISCVLGWRGGPDQLRVGLARGIRSAACWDEE